MARRSYHRGHKTYPRPYRAIQHGTEGQAQCDRCSDWVEHSSLREQTEYRGGTAPVGTGIWVCGKCWDRPNPQGSLNTQVLKQDPVPVQNARPDTTTYDLTIPTYASGSLPNAAFQPPGTQIYVTGLGPEPLLAYADGPVWTGYYTGELVT